MPSWWTLFLPVTTDTSGMTQEWAVAEKTELNVARQLYINPDSLTTGAVCEKHFKFPKMFGVIYQALSN